jgi:hypothetical protein
MNDSDRHYRLRAVFGEALEQEASAREWYLGLARRGPICTLS